ncbi:hypothetical protein F2P79_002314 [Pimephales promelas]|nr:hypothetical protein F2P79_002314 [Pimephales promelas]
MKRWKAGLRQSGVRVACFKRKLLAKRADRDSESISGPCSHNKPVILHQITGEGDPLAPLSSPISLASVPCPLIISPGTLFLIAS